MEKKNQMRISKMLGTQKAKRKTEAEVSESLNTFIIIWSGIQCRISPLLLAQNLQSWGKCPKLSVKLKYIFKSFLSLSFSFFPLKCLILQFSEVRNSECTIKKKKRLQLSFSGHERTTPGNILLKQNMLFPKQWCRCISVISNQSQ